MIYEPRALPYWEQKQGGYWTERISERQRRLALAELRRREHEISFYLSTNCNDDEAEEKRAIQGRIEKLRSQLGAFAPPRPRLKRKRTEKGAPRSYAERRLRGLCGKCARPSGDVATCERCCALREARQAERDARRAEASA